MVRSHGDGPARAAELAADGARLLLGLDPVLGEHTAQVAVDAFVEQAVEALGAVVRAQHDGIPQDPAGPRRAEPR
ncbi:MAG: hypothetical protein ACOYBY_06045 [Dermatophilaceae bacterium]